MTICFVLKGNAPVKYMLLYVIRAISIFRETVLGESLHSVKRFSGKWVSGKCYIVQSLFSLRTCFSEVAERIGTNLSAIESYYWIIDQIRSLKAVIGPLINFKRIMVETSGSREIIV